MRQNSPTGYSNVEYQIFFPGEKPPDPRLKGRPRLTRPGMGASNAGGKGMGMGKGRRGVEGNGRGGEEGGEGEGKGGE